MALTFYNLRDCKLAIADFGLSRGFDTSSRDTLLTEYVVTRWYRAPELLMQSSKYDTAVDMWSVGCIFAEMMTRKPVFQGTSHVHQLNLVVNALGSPLPQDLPYMDDPEQAIRMLPSLPSRPVGHLLKHVTASRAAHSLLSKLITWNPVGFLHFLRD